MMISWLEGLKVFLGKQSHEIIIYNSKIQILNTKSHTSQELYIKFISKISPKSSYYHINLTIHVSNSNPLENTVYILSTETM